MNNKIVTKLEEVCISKTKNLRLELKWVPYLEPIACKFFTCGSS